jgi:hypothetical protein
MHYQHLQFLYAYQKATLLGHNNHPWLPYCLACRERNVILLRPKDFQQHQCAFLVQAMKPPAPPMKTQPVPVSAELPSCSSRSTAGSMQQTTMLPEAPSLQQLKCWRVPSHLQRLADWTHLLSTGLTDHLVLPSQVHSLVLRVLSKVEDPAFIHAYRSASPSVRTSRTANNKSAQDGTPSDESQVLIWELPRYSSEFEQHGGILHSRDHSGYKLAVSQQLVDVSRVDSIIDGKQAGMPAEVFTQSSQGTC